MMAAQQFLAQRGITAPKHYSLYCSEHNPSFVWSDPPVAHSQWDSRKGIERIIRWAKTAASGEVDVEETLFDTEFIEGGTIGAVPSG